MHNLMQNWPLRVGTILDHAARFHGNRTLKSRSIEGPITTSTYTEVHAKARRVAQALARDGIAPGEAVGVMAWNTTRHLEVWYGVSGAGAVLHTLNPRLFADQLDYIINHAEDRLLFVDLDLLAIIEPLMPRLRTVKSIIVMTDPAHMPPTSLDGVICYEEWLASVDGDFDWVPVDETNACGICYTSGTTGNPKGVVYTHRSNVLHSLFSLAPDCLGLSSTNTLMPVVPLFHANGWGTAYTAPMAGAAMVMPGNKMLPEPIFEMLEMGVDITAAVPTVWLGLLQYLRASGKKPTTLERVVIGGSSCPRAVIEAFQHDYGVQVLHAWGMTEMSPLGSVCSFKPEALARDAAGRLDIQETVGHPPYMVDLKIVDDAGADLPWDDTAQGSLLTRGPAVVGEYLKAGKPATDADGWFDTGDVATMDPNGYVRITDRSKDVIKSGGEWISSIDLENTAVAHPDVAEAAAIGVPHPKWDERPILVVVPVEGKTPEKNEIIALCARKFAKWQLPDDVVFMEELPHTATGKISKLHLRQKLKDIDYTLPA